MPTTYRILACAIPLQCATMLAFAWHATRPPATSASTPQADHVVISKSRHTLTLLARGETLHIYTVALGRRTGPKVQEGDHRTPEGHYVVDARNPHSKFHLALHLSYPNAADRTHALTLQRPPGGDVEIHGLSPVFGLLGSLHRVADWTDGCIAVTNSEMDDIYRLVPTGTAVDVQH